MSINARRRVWDKLHNYQPGDLMEWILKAVINYDASKSIGLLTASREFRINTDQLNTILDMLKDIRRKRESTLLRKQFEWLLLRGPADFFRESADTLLNKGNLTSLNRRIISRFAGLPQIDFDAPYDELNRAARSPSILISFDNEDYPAMSDSSVTNLAWLWMILHPKRLQSFAWIHKSMMAGGASYCMKRSEAQLSMSI